VETERPAPLTTSGRPSPRDDLFAVDARSDARLESFLWHNARVLLSRWRLILGTAFAAAVLGVVGLLMIPNEYVASAKVLAPQGGGGNPLTALLGRNVSSAASALMGGIQGDYSRYLTILTSRTLREQIVDRYDLVDVYDLSESAHPREDAIAELGRRTSFPVDLEFEFLSVSVMDRNPERAADMANAMVELLNTRNAELVSQSASSFRIYVEQRYGAAMNRIDSLLTASQEFQQRYGIYDVDAQTQAFFTQMGAVGGDLAQREIEFAAMQQQYGADNPRVRAYAQAVASAQRRYDQELEGASRLLPVPQSQMPSVVRQYLTLERDLTIERATLEAIAPMVETARMQEEQHSEALQIVDPAVPPTQKAWPRRSVLLIVIVLSALLVAAALALLSDAWTRHGPHLRARLRDAPHA
jgi:uncharacterized protein involved in exopolysaccharide biosynthesis